MNNIRDLLDIILITYNRAKDLDKTLSQLFAENSPIKDFEIKIFDNNSTDNTAEIVKKYKNKFPNLKYEKNKYNIGGNANIMKAFTSAEKKYVWVLADNDTLYWDSWDEVVDAINNDIYAIYVSTHDLPQLNIAQRFIQSTFVPGVIYKTELLTSDTIANMAYNISNLFPHLALASEVINENLSYKIVSKSIVDVGKNINEETGKDDYIRGNRADKIGFRVKKMNWLTGFANSLWFIKDKEIRNFIATHNDFYIAPLNTVRAIIYNDEFSNGDLYNLFCMFNVLNFINKIRFILNIILGYTLFRIVYIYTHNSNPRNNEYYYIKYRIRLFNSIKTNLIKIKVKIK